MKCHQVVNCIQTNASKPDKLTNFDVIFVVTKLIAETHQKTKVVRVHSYIFVQGCVGKYPVNSPRLHKHRTKCQ